MSLTGFLNKVPILNVATKPLTKLLDKALGAGGADNVANLALNAFLPGGIGQAVSSVFAALGKGKAAKGAGSNVGEAMQALGEALINKSSTRGSKQDTAGGTDSERLNALKHQLEMRQQISSLAAQMSGALQGNSGKTITMV